MAAYIVIFCVFELDDDHILLGSSSVLLEDLEVLKEEVRVGQGENELAAGFRLDHRVGFMMELEVGISNNINLSDLIRFQVVLHETLYFHQFEWN